jgi:hypothetical protein
MSERKCKGCGCTDATACMTPGGPCHWVAEDQCSGCMVSEADWALIDQIAPLRIQMGAADAIELLTILRMGMALAAKVNPQPCIVCEALVRMICEHVAVTPALREFVGAQSIIEVPAERLDRVMLQRMLDQANDERSPQERKVAIVMYDPKLSEFQELHQRVTGNPWERIRRAIEGGQ